MADEEVSWRQKFDAVVEVLSFRPWFSLMLVLIGLLVAIFESIGIGFIAPIFESAQAEGFSGSFELEIFRSAYMWLGVPYTLENLILGVSIAMAIRYSSSFLRVWLETVLSIDYERHLKEKLFQAALDGRIGYYDGKGTDTILNAVITETKYSKSFLSAVLSTTQLIMLCIMYVGVMLYISPLLTALALFLLGGITILLRYVVEPAIDLGDRIANANEGVQSSVQSGVQGIREIKLFGMKEDVYEDFERSLNKYVDNSVDLSRNKAAITNVYKTSAAVSLFSLIYIGLEYTGLNFGSLGVFLFAMLMLAPRISNLNSKVYKLEGYISHLKRTEKFLEELEANEEPSEGKDIENVSDIVFNQVGFSYNPDEKVLDSISFEIEKGDFVAFVGKSGAGKSTIVDLIVRMYDSCSGEITSNSENISNYNLRKWRERFSMVRQQSHIFNTTLKENVKVGKPEATMQEVKKVCRAAKVDEFLDDLPNGYDTQLGDDGVRLSGGQRQRVALARALIKDADFLILDEATSDLDSGLEKKVQDSIESMDTDYGVIAIAHRLSTVQNADIIYTVDGGEIIEKGTHRQLMEKEGVYSELYSIQSDE